jgi:mannose-1-phosphate guanylyltransferase
METDTEPAAGTDPAARTDGGVGPDRPLVALVMAGGTGTRLYPASRPGREKQFLDFGTGRSLLARTVERAAFADRTFVLASPATAERARETVADLDHEVTVLVEPAARDTGPALVYAAHRVREAIGDCVLCCLPSDHHVGDGFAATMARAADVAVDTGGLVLLGIDPDRAATGYGYLKPGEARTLELVEGDGARYHTVEKFYEKPDAGAAARYRQSGYLWNAGTFAWTPEALLGAARDSPLSGLVEACEDGVPEAGYEDVEDVSIDHAVLERHGGGAERDESEGASDAHEVFVVSADFDWDDLGTWDALDSLLDRDAGGNVVAGEGRSLAIDSEGCTLAAGPESHVTVVDADDLVVATYDGRTLVVPERRADRVREVVDVLRERGEYPG